MTDALRGAIIAAVNAVFVCLQAFQVPLTNEQQAAIGAAINAVLVVWLVWRHSAKQPA